MFSHTCTCTCTCVYVHMPLPHTCVVVSITCTHVHMYLNADISNRVWEVSFFQEACKVGGQCGRRDGGKV